MNRTLRIFLITGIIVLPILLVLSLTNGESREIPSAKNSTPEQNLPAIPTIPTKAEWTKVKDTFNKDNIKNTTQEIPLECSKPSFFLVSNAYVQNYETGPVNIPCRFTINSNNKEYILTFEKSTNGDENLNLLSQSNACNFAMAAQMNDIAVNLQGNWKTCGTKNIFTIKNISSINPPQDSSAIAFIGKEKFDWVETTGVVNNYSVSSNQYHVNCSANIISQAGRFGVSSTPYPEYYDAGENKDQYTQWTAKICGLLQEAFVKQKPIIIGGNISVEASTYYEASVNAKTIKIFTQTQ